MAWKTSPPELFRRFDEVVPAFSFRKGRGLVDAPGRRGEGEVQKPSLLRLRSARRARRLGPTLGLVLVQLPPRWAPDLPLSNDFLAEAPRDIRWVVEVRALRRVL